MEPPLGRNGRIDEGRRRRRRDTYENTLGIFIVRNGPSDVCKKAFQWRGGRTPTRPSSTRRKRRGGKTRGHFREVKLAVRGPHFSPNMSSSDDNFRRSNLNSAPPPPNESKSPDRRFSLSLVRVSRVFGSNFEAACCAIIVPPANNFPRAFIFRVVS